MLEKSTKQIELEVKLLEVNPREVINKLEISGAKKILDVVSYIEAFDYDGEIYPLNIEHIPERFKEIFDEIVKLTNGENDLISKKAYLRLRSEGERCELILKYKVATNLENIKAESETSVPINKNEWENISNMLVKSGLKLILIQEKKRISYIHKEIGARFDIDTWPHVPTYVEVEGTSEAIEKGAALLGYSMDQVSSISGKALFQKYGVDPRNLRFEK